MLNLSLASVQPQLRFLSPHVIHNAQGCHDDDALDLVRAQQARNCT